MSEGPGHVVDGRRSHGADVAAREARREVYQGRIVRLAVDAVRFPDGSEGELELVEHPGAAAVVPVLGNLDDRDPEILLVHQYRYAAGGLLHEVPAGIPNQPEETWEDCARRELEEETGYRTGELRYLTQIHTSPGFCDEVIRIYVATGLTRGAQAHDPDEFIELRRLPYSRALSMVRSGEITDAKTVAALLYAAAFVLGA